MGVQQAYNQWSQSYDTDRNLTRDLDEKVLRETLTDRHFHSILEIGCGTGKNTVSLAGIGERVHALDFSEGMIQKAREKVGANHVRFSMADLTQRWPCEEGAYDLVVCNLVLEHIEDLSFVFAEAARALKAGGTFLIHELHPFKQYEGKRARFDQGNEIVEVPAFVHHISEYFNSASRSGFKLVQLNEWWHEEDENKPPRIVAFAFER